MLNTHAWLEELEELRSSPVITIILKEIRLENISQSGIKMCTKFSRRRELKSGACTRTPTPIDLVKALERSAERLKVSIDVVHEGIPRPLVADDDLVELIFDNGVHNAQQHGLQDGVIQITLRANSNTVI